MKYETKKFTAAKEKEFWDWLGDAYISSSDFSMFNESGHSETHTTMKIKTVDGVKEVNEGDFIGREEDGTFTVMSEEQLNKIINKDVLSEQ